VIAKSGKKPQQSAGIFALQRPGKFRWSYESPYKQLLVSDGTKLWSYDPDLNQVAVKKLGTAFGASPAALLAGQDLDKHFELKEGVARRTASTTSRPRPRAVTPASSGSRSALPPTAR
jgi:outer membrane lipoprotein carrier protein